MGGILGGGGGGNNTVQPVAAGLRVQTSAYGLTLPIVYGRTRVTGNLIWYNDFTPIPHTTTQSSGGKGGGGGGSSNTTFTYTTSFMLALCEGAITGIYSGWRDKDVLALADVNKLFTTFLGAYPQTPWSYLATAHLDQSIGYQGIAYMAAAIYDLQASPVLPNHSFEVGGKFSTTATGANKTITLTAPTNGAAVTITPQSLTTAGGMGWGVTTSILLTAASNAFAKGDVIQFTSTGTLPTAVVSTGLFKPTLAANLTINTPYTVLKMTAGLVNSNSFMAFNSTTYANILSLADAQGRAITVTSNGTGVLSAVKVTYASIITSTAHGLANNTIVNLSGTLPSPLVGGVDYYVIGATTNTLQLSATLGGTAIQYLGSASAVIFTKINGGNPRDIIVDLLTSAHYGAGFPASKFGNLTIFSAFCVADGLAISPVYNKQKAAHEIITDLMTLTNSAVYFSEGLLKIVPLSDTSVSANGANYFAPNTPVYDLNDDDFIITSGEPVKMHRNSTADAFNQIQVEFLNSVNQYNVEISEARDQAAVDTYGLLTKNPLTMHAITDAATARNVAQMILQRALYVRNTFEFTLSWKYCLLEPTDILTITDADLGLNAYAVRITAVEEDADGQLNITAEDYPAGVTHSATYPSASGTGWSTNYNITGGMVVTPAFFEVPATKSATGLAVSVAVTGNDVNYGGCEIWTSYDGTTYKRIGKVYGGSRYGVTTNTVTSADAQVQSVALSGNGGQLLAASATDAANLATLCLVGDEYLSYTTAALTSANNYNLTLKARGSYQTPAAAHSSGAKFIRIDNAITTGDNLALSMIGQTLHFKFLSFNKFSGGLQALGDVVDYTYTVTGVMAKLPPTDVASLTYSLNTGGIAFAWSDITDGDRKDYELRKGATWATATSMGFFGSNNANIPPQLAGTNIYQVRARDAFLNYSNNAATVSVAIALPLAPAVTSTIIGAEFNLSWTAPTAAFAIDHYEIRNGVTWATAAYVATSGGQVYQAPVTFSGAVNFLVAAVDAVGNVGAAGGASVTILAPTAPTVTAQVIDNNVLLYWNDTHLTLPIKTYEIRKGATFATAVVIGTKSGLFTSLFETASGVFTYWVVAIDSAGNYGTQGAIAATVSQPPDYVLKANFNSTLNGTLSNAVLNAAGVNMPINTADQFGTHFSSRSWASPQAQITAGYPILVEPAAASGYYEETINYGILFASCKVTVSPAVAILDGAPTVVYTISTSPNGTTWTDYVGVTQVYGTNFQYVKVRVAVASSAGHDLLTLSGLNVRLDVKLKNDAGNVAVVSTDNSAAVTGAAIGGTTVLFNVPFINVTSITLSAQGTTAAYTPIYDFIGATINPIGFKVYLYNSAGARVSGSVSWSAKGY